METLNQKLSGYYEYFEILRKKIYSLAVVFVIFFITGFLSTGHLLKFIVRMFGLENVTIVTSSPFQFLDLATKVGLYSGIIVCIPFLIYHAYDFLKDGLNRKEKKLFFILLPIGFLLFLFGFSYSLTILYFYLSSVSSLNLTFGIGNVWDIGSFLSQIILASTFLGLIFEFPIVLTFLIQVGLLKLEYLKKNRMYIYAGMCAFVGLLPPPDIFSTLFQVTPLIIIFQLTLWVNSFFFFRKGDIVETITPVSDIMNTTV